MKSKFAIFLLFFLLLLPITAMGQKAGADFLIQGTVTARADGFTLIGVNVTEIDVNNRVVSGTVTDMNGQFVLKIKNPDNKLSFTYLGYIKQIKKIEGKHVLNVVLSESTHEIANVVITAQKKNTQGGFSIPTREISTAMQTIDTKEFEGLQVSSVDEALQGRIAGLDIVSNSGDPGSGTSMRIRGTTSINGSSQPLIVVNGVPYEVQVDPNFDFANSNQEQYASMLSINPDDIQEISVLKDAASSAIWGSKGANGVLMITTKKGAMGPTRIDYSYRFTGTVQPKGMKMLSGDDYTMLMKQAYFNPQQSGTASNVDEFNYDKSFSEYENFNNNTDWVKEVTQVGSISDHYITLSGGGERAMYRVAGGFLTQNGTIIGQKLSRISSRAYLEYSVSDRLKFISEFSFTYTDNNMNYGMEFGDANGKKDHPLSILGIAYKKMPNVGVYAQNSQGENTSELYKISDISQLNGDQKYLVNPVALATLAKNNLKSYRILPTFRLQYDLLDPEKQMLRYSMYVSFDINNDKGSTFLPQSVINRSWSDGGANRSGSSDSEGLTIQTDNNIAWMPSFSNKDHSLLLYGSFQTTEGRSSSQGITTYSLEGLADASSTGYLDEIKASSSNWRSLGILGRFHYSYKSRYILDGTLRRDGSTKFGNGNKYGNFPGVSLKWIVSDEPFMKSTNKWLSMLAFRPGWGISGNQPKYEYLHFSRYGNYDRYIDMAATQPVSIRLNNLKWETTASYNYGCDLGFLDDTYVFDLNLYSKRTTDLLFEKTPLPTSSGFGVLSYQNAGIMDNNGWEVNFYANKFIKTKDFSVDFRFNLSNYVNTLVKLDPGILAGINSEFDNNNGTYLTRIQEGNAFGSIYGFRYKGVYQYDEYVAGVHEDAPVSRDASGNINVDENGKPIPMVYIYNTTSKSSTYEFKGGDAKYEDINHDGSIDKLDIVYLGNTNPLLSGGFGPTFRYKNLSCNMFFNFRYGNKIVNRARMWAENMYGNDNQSTAVNWRWRKDGDVTNMPRALYNYGFNWLGSDRYVEDGSFLRFKYLTFNYTVPSANLKKYNINKMNLYLTFNNIFVLTKYTGVDPEVGYGNLGSSFDDAKTPRSKDLTLGITIGL
jgi:TonB-linked SusC/RagA family outer membrane protein